MSQIIRLTKSQLVLKAKVDKCIDVLLNKKGWLLKRYIRTTSMAGKETDYFTKHICCDEHNSIRLTPIQYQKLRPLAESLGMYIEDNSLRATSRYHNRTLK